MYRPNYTKQFEKDLKKAKKAGKDIDKLKKIFKTLLSEEDLKPKYKDHKLIGNYKNRRECHISPDWLLIYKIEDDCITFERTGSHSNLFKN